MASPAQRVTWANSRKRCGTGRTGVLQSMGPQRVRHHWATEQQVKNVHGSSLGIFPFSHLLVENLFFLKNTEEREWKDGGVSSAWDPGQASLAGFKEFFCKQL